MGELIDVFLVGELIDVLHAAWARAGHEVYAAFLPLAHILELAAEHAMLCCGAALGYCDPRTLTPSGAEPRGALEEFRWVRLKDGI